ncbi:hypothetical protein EJ08DRAFT_65254 [Tothia fuscella]|uniref:Uncharacterized protein n=1 Tax=Tothia fuscella TaxID=1048955 RepID=A0A9P4NF76_9PEZI|nr:hypothetical protein EJ08DRAFT_65254 [Tothia fuscella]
MASALTSSALPSMTYNHLPISSLNSTYPTAIASHDANSKDNPFQEILFNVLAILLAFSTLILAYLQYRRRKSATEIIRPNSDIEHQGEQNKPYQLSKAF